MPTESTAEAVPVAPSVLLRAKLAALRRKHLLIAVLTGVTLLVSVTIEVLALAMFFDWLLDLPWAIRLVLLAGQLALFAYILLRFVLWPVVRQPDDDELALSVERARPALRSRLIASIQLTRPGVLEYGASDALVRAMLQETENVSRPIDFRAIVSTDKLTKFGLLAVFVVGIGAFAMAYGKSTTSDLLKRAFLSNTPVPRKTRVLVQEGNKTIGVGDSVRLEGFAQGIIPRAGKVEVRYRGRRAQEFGLEPDKQNRALFGRTLNNVQDSFSYVIALNDGRSATYQVKALPRPTISAVECEQVYPAYTAKTATRRALGDLSLLAGSVLKLKITATKDIAAGSIKLVGLKTNVPLQVVSGKSKELLGQFAVPAKGLTGFSVLLRDTEGMDSKDSAVYRVDVIPDKPPVVRLTNPDRKEELITRHATLLLGLEANDDFQVAHIRIRYKVHSLSPGLEISDFRGFAGKLKERKDPVSQLLMDKFSPPMREGLKASSGKSNELASLQGGVTDELNGLLKTAFYDRQRFARVQLSAETKDLLQENLEGDNLLRLNRSLLRDAYPTELSIDDGAQKTIELDLKTDEPLPLKRRYEWKIGAFDPLLPEGTRIEFWIEAEDNNNVTGPSIGLSEHQFAKVVSESEKRADLLNRAGDYLGSIGDVAGDQEKLNRNLGLIIREKSSSR